MKLCVNYLEEVKELVEEEKIGFILKVMLYNHITELKYRPSH